MFFFRRGDWVLRTRQLGWPQDRRRMIRMAAYSGVAVGGVVGVAYYWPELSFLGQTISRNTRMAWTVARVAWDYRQHYKVTKGKLPEQFDPSQPILPSKGADNHELHLRSAHRLLRLFEHNGGIYIKIGQHLAALEHLLPPEYCQTMSVLHSQAPTSSLAEVERVVGEEIGHSLAHLFASFDPRPLGAASLAQVHRATIRSPVNGTLLPVAVKVQHARLHGQVDMDLLTVSAAVKAVKWLLPAFTLDWLAEEMRMNLPLELDFEQEGMNAERMARELRPLFGDAIHIPTVYWDLTRKRVLVMEDVTYDEQTPTAQINDLSFLQRHGIRPLAVARRLTEMYSAMIFLRGFVHCDPHPGNLMVRVLAEAGGNSWWRRYRPWGKGWQLILLDHGLYRELPEEFRLNYAHLWDALIRGDEVAIKRYCEALGAGEAHRMLSCVLTHRSWTSIAARSIHEPGTPAELAYLRERAPELLGMVADLLGRIPRPLLLLLKTNDLLRGVERQLLQGGGAVTVLTMARYCQVAIREETAFCSLARLRSWWTALQLALADWYLYLFV